MTASPPGGAVPDETSVAWTKPTRRLLQEELLGIWEATRTTVVFITHSVDEAIVLGDQVVVFTAHPGRVKAVLPIDFPRPRQVYELKADPRFGQLAYRLWGLLRDEVLQARQEEVGLR